MIPNFHDGNFDGIWIRPQKEAHLYLRNVDRVEFVLVLDGVERVAINNFSAGNIILDLIARPASQITEADIAILYGVAVEDPQTQKLLQSAQASNLQVLEINSSYGADGLVLFRGWRLGESAG